MSDNLKGARKHYQNRGGIAGNPIAIPYFDVYQEIGERLCEVGRAIGKSGCYGGIFCEDIISDLEWMKKYCDSAANVLKQMKEELE